jgi:beta-glucosidase
MQKRGLHRISDTPRIHFLTRLRAKKAENRKREKLDGSNKRISRLWKLTIGAVSVLLFLVGVSFLLESPVSEKPVPRREPLFPQGFFFGASTSSHQVEGRTNNQWTKWEKENADRLAAEAGPIADFSSGRGKIPHWELIKPQAKAKENYISGTAVDHYHRYSDDLAMAKGLGLNAYRFSLEWSRIEPAEGRFDQAEIDHYRQMIRAVRSLGMEPFVGLWHWTEPLWFTEKGGWASAEAVRCFSLYVRTVARELGDEVRYWIPTNEIEVFAAGSYLIGTWPPQERNFLAYNKVIHNLVDAHKEAYRILKTHSPQMAQVGSAVYYTCFQARGGIMKPLGVVIARLADWYLNYHILRSIMDTSDFVGLNYYQRCVIKGTHIFYAMRRVPRDDTGQELYPQGILFALRALKKYRKPIFITENGLADVQNRYAPWFIRTTLGCVAQALGEGIDIKGYFFWSLLDNFEWGKGFWPRYGLIGVDRHTLERSIRPIAREYEKIIRESGRENGIRDQKIKECD